jgi:hypothetical protein
MSRFTLRPVFSSRKAAAFAAAALLALAACEDDRMAGTSVGTGNPTEIQLGFRDASGTAALSGRVSVYAATQIPVEGYRPEPLLKYDLENAPYATLKAADFAALPDTVWAKGSIDNSVRSFNVVITGASQGSILEGFRFDKAKGAFELRSEDEGAPWNEAHDRVMLKDSLRALVELKGTVDTANVNRFKDYHLFLYGTGFTSKINNGSFALHGVPDGAYNAFLISLPQKDSPLTGIDSTDIFSTTAPLAAGTTELSRGALYERVRLPDSLIRP